MTTSIGRVSRVAAAGLVAIAGLVASLGVSMRAAAQTGVSPVMPSPVPPAPSPFVPAPVFSSGDPPLAMVVFTGGSIAGLEAGLRSVGASGAWAQTEAGAFVLYIASGPEFVNAPAAASVPGGFTRPIAVTLVKGDETAPGEVQLTQEDDGATVSLARGGTLTVALPSNATTGYRWAIGDGTDAGLELIDVRYVPPGSTAPVVGAPGTEVFRFRAARAGALALRLEYRRGFEPPDVPAADTFAVTVQAR